MPAWGILGQADSTSTGTLSDTVVYTNGTTDGMIGWALICNRTTAAILTDLWVSTSTAKPDASNIVHFPVPLQDTVETPRFTLSTGDAVVWRQATTGLSVSVFGAEGISTA